MGTKARGGITLYNVKNGKDAEHHRLRPQSEKAVVGADNSLYITLSYIIEHVNGAQVTTEAGSAQGYHVTARMNNGVSIAMTNGAVNSGTYKLTDYSKAQNRPDYVIIELRDSADKVVDIRTAQIIMEASSYVDIVADLRTTVSQHGDSISTIKQTADSISLKVDGIKNGVKNLIKGGQLNRTFKTYGIGGDDVMIPLKPNTVYTLTICGHTNNITRANGQMLRAYIFRKDWAWSANTDIDNNSDTISSITFSIPSDKASTDGMYKFDAYPFPDKGSQNSEVTVNWAVVTEGTAPAAEWIPSAEESSEERVKKVEAKLENGEFRVKSEKTVFVDNTGKETVLIEGGKLSAVLIDAVKIVAAGIQAQEIDAGKATIKNLTVSGESKFEGELEGVTGSFKNLDCRDENGKKVGGVGFGTDGSMLFDGDIYAALYKEVNGRKRPCNFFAQDIWVNGQFGHRARTCVVVNDDVMYVHHGGHEYSAGVKVQLDYDNLTDGGRVYYVALNQIGMRSSKYGSIKDYDNPKIKEMYPDLDEQSRAFHQEEPFNASIDVVVFNCTQWRTYCFIGMGYGKQWTVINGNDYTSVTICCHGGAFDVHGGYVLDCCYVNPVWLSPSSVDATSPGAGVMVGREMDMNWR